MYYSLLTLPSVERHPVEGYGVCPKLEPHLSIYLVRATCPWPWWETTGIRTLHARTLANDRYPSCIVLYIHLHYVCCGDSVWVPDCNILHGLTNSVEVTDCTICCGIYLVKDRITLLLFQVYLVCHVSVALVGDHWRLHTPCAHMSPRG